MKASVAAILAVLSPFADAGELNVRLTEAADAGVIVFQVYDSPNAFGDFRDPVREVRVEARGDGDYVIDDVPPGEIAVLVYLDENDNGLIDKNFIGIPREPLGLSNNYRPKGPPSFQRASFLMPGGERHSIDIEMFKVLGDRGRLGVGVGVVGQSSPYAGSNETVLQPIPAITYNGERLQWLGPNVQYGLAGSGRLRLAASASYRIGAYEEDDSEFLQGLGDRRGTLLAGLGLRYEIPGGVNLLMRYEHDVLDRVGGGVGTARLSKGFQAGIFRFVPQLQANWLSSDIADYDFGVPAEAATPERPAWSAGSSLSYEVGFGSFIELTETWRILLNLSAEFLPDGITDSPIVDDDRIIKGFAAITWVF